MFFWLFINRKNDTYYIIQESNLSGSGRFSLESEGYELVSDSAKSRGHAIQILQDSGQFMGYDFQKLSPLELKIRPITFREAKSFINSYHRHHPAPQGHKFSIGLFIGDHLIGVAIGGRPVARHLDQPQTLEITRCCVKNGYPNACSKLYGSMIRIAKEMGYDSIYTYTLSEEDGSSLKASGFTLKNLSKGGSWHRSHRVRKDKHPTTPKKVWVRTFH